MTACMHGYADDRPCDRCAPTAAERRVEVAAEAMMVHEHCDKRQALDPETQWQTRFSPEDREEYRALARAVVAALDAHDGDLRERLAGAVEAAALADAGAPWVSGLHIAARLIRERP